MGNLLSTFAGYATNVAIADLKVDMFKRLDMTERNCLHMVDNNGKVISYPGTKQDGTSYEQNVYAFLFFSPSKLTGC